MMQKAGIAVALSILPLIVSVALSDAASARVLISTFRFKICITGVKHPEGCKDVAADARVVVSDDDMATLDGEIGQGATIAAAPDRGFVPASSGQERRRRRPQQ
jgi:hypothetical protein